MIKGTYVIIEKMIKIAIIDNGINTMYISSGKVIQKKNWCKLLGDSDSLSYHGTVCAKIIEDICPETLFCDLRVVSQKGEIEHLISALEWCYTNRIKLINLSIGTISKLDGAKLKPIIDKLLKNRIFIVASYHNDNIKTFPASFTNVFGVCHVQTKDMKDGEHIVQYVNNQKIYVACMKSVYLGNGVTINSNHSNSFATPVITAKIALFLNQKENANLKEVEEYLKKMGFSVSAKY